MTVSCRIGITHTIVLAFIAGTLAACGVKGDLERPPAAGYAEPAPAAKPDTRKVFTERSVVRRVPAHDILPKMPPEEWSKEGKDYQSTRAPKKTEEPDRPDRPFILDGLL